MVKLRGCGRSWLGVGALLSVALVAACSTDTVLSMRPAEPVAAAPGLQRLVPSNPFLIGYPRVENPSSPRTVFSAEQAECRRALDKLDVSYRNLAPINDGGACFIDAPVSVSAIGSVEMKPAATLSCDMALAFAQWTKKELVPSARWRYWSGVRTIHQGSSYSCRRIRGTATASEHAKGNALDVMGIELKNGEKIDVRKPCFFSFWQRGFLNNVRADGCSYFNTVLGPGYNYDHRNHFHFDIKERRNGYRACK